MLLSLCLFPPGCTLREGRDSSVCLLTPLFPSCLEQQFSVWFVELCGSLRLFQGGTPGQDYLHNYTKKSAFFSASAAAPAVPKPRGEDCWCFSSSVLTPDCVNCHGSLHQHTFSLKIIQFHFKMSLMKQFKKY